MRITDETIRVSEGLGKPVNAILFSLMRKFSSASKDPQAMSVFCQEVTALEPQLREFTSLIKTTFENSPSIKIDKNYSFLLYQAYVGVFESLTTTLVRVNHTVDTNRAMLTDAARLQLINCLLNMHHLQAEACATILNNFSVVPKRLKTLKRLDAAAQNKQLLVAVDGNGPNIERKYDASKYRWTLEDIYFCIGDLYVELANYDLAQEFYTLSFHYLDTLKVDRHHERTQPGSIAVRKYETLIKLASVALETGEVYAAAQYLDKAFSDNQLCKPRVAHELMKKLVDQYVAKRKFYHALSWTDRAVSYCQAAIQYPDNHAEMNTGLQTVMQYLIKRKPIIKQLYAPDIGKKARALLPNDMEKLSIYDDSIVLKVQNPALLERLKGPLASFSQWTIKGNELEISREMTAPLSAFACLFRAIARNSQAILNAERAAERRSELAAQDKREKKAIQRTQVADAKHAGVSPEKKQTTIEPQVALSAPAVEAASSTASVIASAPAAPTEQHEAAPKLKRKKSSTISSSGRNVNDNSAQDDNDADEVPAAEEALTTAEVDFTDGRDGPKPAEHLFRLHSRALQRGPYCYLDRHSLFAKSNNPDELIKASESILQRGKIVPKQGEQGVVSCKSERADTPYKIKFKSALFGNVRVFGELVGTVDSANHDSAVPVLAFNQVNNKAH